MHDFLTLDLESTGVDPAKDRIIQIGLLGAGEPTSWLVNPERKIPPEVTELTGITNADVADAPTFAQIAAQLWEKIQGRVLVSFNGLRFDVPLLAEEFERCQRPIVFGPLIDAGNLFKLHHQRRLQDAVRLYLGLSEAEAFDAHNAEADAVATRDVFLAQLQKMPALAGKTLEEAAKMSAYGRTHADPFGKLVWIDGRICYNTHRNQGVAVEDEPGYAEWMLRGDFPLSTKRVLRRELDRISPPPETGSLFDDS